MAAKVAPGPSVLKQAKPRRGNAGRGDSALASGRPLQVGAAGGRGGAGRRAGGVRGPGELRSGPALGGSQRSLRPPPAARRHALLHGHRGHRQPVVRWHRRLHLPQPRGHRGLQREAPAGQGFLQRLRARRGEGAAAGASWAVARGGEGGQGGEGPGEGPPAIGAACGWALQPPVWEPGPVEARPSRRGGGDHGQGLVQGEALLPRAREGQGLLSIHIGGRGSERPLHWAPSRGGGREVWSGTPPPPESLPCGGARGHPEQPPAVRSAVGGPGT